MQTSTQKEERVVLGRSLIDLVFSWSIKDVLNKDIYKNKVLKSLLYIHTHTHACLAHMSACIN